LNLKVDTFQGVLKPDTDFPKQLFTCSCSFLEIRVQFWLSRTIREDLGLRDLRPLLPHTNNTQDQTEGAQT